LHVLWWFEVDYIRLLLIWGWVGVFENNDWSCFFFLLQFGRRLLNLKFFVFYFLILVHAFKEILPTFIFKFEIVHDPIVLFVRKYVLDAWSADVINVEAVPSTQRLLLLDFYMLQSKLVHHCFFATKVKRGILTWDSKTQN
jgi:hypothetical protein